MIESILSRLASLVSEESPIDHYEIRYRGFEDRGWRRLDSIDAETELVPEFDSPLAKDGVRQALVVDGLPPGVYKLYGIREDGTLAEPRWTIEHDGRADET